LQGRTSKKTPEKKTRRRSKEKKASNFDLRPRKLMRKFGWEIGKLAPTVCDSWTQDAGKRRLAAPQLGGNDEIILLSTRLLQLVYTI